MFILKLSRLENACGRINALSGCVNCSPPPKRTVFVHLTHTSRLRHSVAVQMRFAFVV